MGLGVEIAAAEKSCQRGPVCNKTEALACQELLNTPYAPVNRRVFTFRGSSPQI